MRKKEENTIKKALLDFFVKNCILFGAVESESLKTPIKALNPAYLPMFPSKRHWLVNLLRTIHFRSKIELPRDLKNGSQTKRMFSLHLMAVFGSLYVLLKYT